MQEEKKNTGKAVFFYVLSFFCVVILVDGVFVYFAERSYSGLVAENAYEKGLSYNNTIMTAERQNNLNISSQTDYKNSELTFTLKGSDGTPVPDARVKAHILRPAQDGYDFDVVFQKKNEGTYGVLLKLPLSGVWIAKIEASWDTNTYRTTYRFQTE